MLIVTTGNCHDQNDTKERKVSRLILKFNLRFRFDKNVLYQECRIRKLIKLFLGDGSSSPESPDTDNLIQLRRSPASPENKTLRFENTFTGHKGRTVSVPRPDDDTFTNFFKTIDEQRRITEKVSLSIDDFNYVERESEELLVQKRNIAVQKRRKPMKNPIKALAARTDIKYEYTEVITGVAEREKKRLNVEKCM